MENIRNGKILKGVGGLYTVRLTAQDGSSEMITCRARGVFRHLSQSPLPGDDVTVVREDTPGEKGANDVIHAIGERKNALIRPPLANLDYLFVTMAAASPDPVLFTVDKLISIAEYNRIEPIIVITKSELNPDYASKLETIYRTSGFTVFSLSARENLGIEPLKHFVSEKMNHKIAAFAGASGIGKSTLMNTLFPNLNLNTFEVSPKIRRGRHTTRETELFPLSDSADCGYIADTPGFSMLDFERFDFFEKEDLPTTMREFLPYIGQCRYTKCSHTKEEGCAILNALHEGKISPSRHASFVELYNILKQKKKWD